jgi:hypothetical protein
MAIVSQSHSGSQSLSPSHVERTCSKRRLVVIINRFNAALDLAAVNRFHPIF